MGKKHLAAASATFILPFLCVATAAASTLTTPERALVGEINRVRAEHGVKPLRLDWRLQRAARAHSTDMLRRDYFAHGPFASRIRAFGAAGSMLGENLAWGVGARARADAIVRAWLASPGHRRNLLRPVFSRVGVASRSGEFRGYTGARVVTADFAG